MTEDAKYADVVLPATTLWENDSFCEYPGGIRLREQIIEPVGEAKADLFIYQQLAEYMGRRMPSQKIRKNSMDKPLREGSPCWNV